MQNLVFKSNLSPYDIFLNSPSGSHLTFVCFQEEEDDDEEEDEEEEDDEDDDDDDEGSEEEADGEDYAKLPQVATILRRDGPQPPLQPPLPPSPQAQPQPPPPPLQAPFVPIPPLPDYNPADYPGSTSPELQRVLVGQPMLGQQGQGQQLTGLGPGILPQQAPDGLMVATPAQTLTDTLDDIMAGKSYFWVLDVFVLSLGLIDCFFPLLQL